MISLNTHKSTYTVLQKSYINSLNYGKYFTRIHNTGFLFELFSIFNSIKSIYLLAQT